MADDRSVLEAAGGLDNIQVLVNRVTHIDSILSDFAKSGNIPSQANARTYQDNSSRISGSTFRDRMSGRGSFSNSRFGRSGSGSFTDSFESALIEGLVGSGFKTDVKKVFQGFADQLGTNIRGIPDEFGKRLGKSVADAFKNTDTGKALTAQIDKWKSNFLGNLQQRGNSMLQNVLSGNTAQRGANALNQGLSNFGTRQTMIGNFLQGAGTGVRGMFNIARSGLSALRGAPGNIASMFQNPAPLGPQSMPGHIIGPSSADTMAETVEQVTKLGETSGSAVSSLAKIGPQGMAVVGALVAIEVVSSVVTKSLKTMGEGLKQLLGAWKKAANRDQESREKNLKLANDRMRADYEALVKAPFELLKDAANDLYQTWSQTLTTISATQGYTKSDVQDLMAAYAERIRDEGLSKYVSGTDLMSNLSKVLESGMSGAIAEEFAYQATVLNKAVPTQDFFQYATTYASIAANAIRSGVSQQEAISKANKSLESFASGLLYTTRELTGGFTTGLQNASSLYEEASKIAVAAHSDNLDAISGTLLAIQGYVGAVAPDLASSLTSTIYTLATGGNNASTVALRSLAGINASNTEFLRAFASNPQSVLGSMFENLANMYTQSPDAYMEKAEGYASLFGLDAQAFQRIDFNELAKAIRNMNMNNNSLNENMELLLDGQTTTSTEQLKAQQINQYMIEEGLAYVIDNDVAQMIQQHMWDEQMNRELMEAMYSVDLAGESASGLQKIVQGVQNIINFLNPFSWMKKIGNLISTNEEGMAQKADVRQLLELSKVGVGRQMDLYRLTTSNTDLGLATPIVNQMGGSSSYAAQTAVTKRLNAYGNPLFSSNNSISDVQSVIAGRNAQLMDQQLGAISGPTSKYSWGGTTKSQAAKAYSALTSGLDVLVTSIKNITGSSGSVSATASTAKSAISKMLESSYIQDQFVKAGKTYEDWAATASKFGIADFKQALESAGYTEDQVQKYFSEQETSAGAKEQHERNVREDEFWAAGTEHWTKYFPNDFSTPLFEELSTIESDYLQTIIDKLGSADASNTVIGSQASILAAINYRSVQSEIQWSALLGAGLKNGGAFGSWMESWSNWKGGSDKVTYNWNTFTTALAKFWGFGKGAQDGLLMKMYNTVSDYMLHKSYYGISGDKTIKDSALWKKLDAIEEDTKKEDRKSSAYQLGKVLSEELLDTGETDPALQTNILLGQILVYVGKIMQQTENTGGSAMIDQLAAMSLGLTQKTT